jgi:hypothetical protein
MKRMIGILATLLVATGAQAQDNPELGDVGAEGGAGAEGEARFGTSGDASASASAFGGSSDDTGDDTGSEDDLASGDSDHANVVGKLGVGYFGIIDVPFLGCDTPGPGGCGGQTPATVFAPTIGARYWLNDMLAIEGALGIGLSNSTLETTTAAGSVETPLEPSIFAVALHGGVPISLASDGHFSFQVVPLLNLGYASGSYDIMGGTSIDTDGFLLELGATAGAEIHFGFIDIPQLALQGTVGLSMRMESRGLEISDMAGTTELDQSNFRLGTTLGNEPWDIFTGGITAIYYFGL